MSNDNTIHASGKVNFQVKRCAKTLSQLRATVNHNKRIGREGQGAHIDERRSPFNEEILGTNAEEIYLNLFRRISGREISGDRIPAKEELRDTNGHKVRSDANLAIEIETSYPGDLYWCYLDSRGVINPVPDEVKIGPDNVENLFLMPLNEKDFENWKKATIDFIKDRYGEENVLSAHVHKDEGEPHIHAIIVPIVEGNSGALTLSAKAVIGNQKDLAQLQTDYARALKPLGYMRGDYFSSRKSNYSTKEFKARVNQVLSEEVPETLQACQEEVRNLRAKNCQLEIELYNTKKADSNNKGLRKRVKELEEENHDLKEQLLILSEKELCEEKGYDLTIERGLDNQNSTSGQDFSDEIEDGSYESEYDENYDDDFDEDIDEDEDIGDDW